MNRCYVIAEAGLNHNGSMDIARKLIDVAAMAGADCVKFQKRHVATLATRDVLDAEDKRFPTLGRTYREVRERHEFDEAQFRQLKAEVEARGMDFLCTPFDMPSFEFLQRLGVAAFKLASHSVTNLPLLERVAAAGKPTFLSTGMCTLDEIDDAVAAFRRHATKLTLFHCVSSYPQPVEESNLRAMDTLRERYGLPVGYSGHEMGWLPTLAAVARGAVAVERHYTLDHGFEGFDHKMSLEPQEFQAMVRDLRAVEAALGTGEKRVTEKEMVTRRKYHVSMVSARPIPAGTRITADMVTYRNPGTGLAPRDAKSVVGKRAARDIPEDVLLDPSMVE